MSGQPPTQIELKSSKRSRASFHGNVTRVKEKLMEMQYGGSPDCLSLSTLQQYEGSIARSGEGFHKAHQQVLEGLDYEATASLLNEEEEEQNLRTFLDHYDEATTLVKDLVVSRKVALGGRALELETQVIRDRFDADSTQPQVEAFKLLTQHLDKVRDDLILSNLEPAHLVVKKINSISDQISQLRIDFATASPPSTSRSSTISAVDETCTLPKIDIPTFSGDVMQWSSFWGQFDAVVHSNSRLKPFRKLAYLQKAILEPAAARVLAQPPVGDNFYEDKIAELKERFDRKREIHQRYCHQIAHISCRAHSRKALLQSADDISMAIDHLRLTKHYDMDSFLSSLYITVLPAEVQTLWERTMKDSRSVPPVEELVKFVRSHARSLPDTSHAAKATSDIQEKRIVKPADKKVYKVNTYASTDVSSSPYRRDCHFCPGDRHPLFTCSKWDSMSVEKRMAHIHDNQLCLNCLSVGHETDNCRSSYSCRRCKERHHTTIHDAESVINPVNSATSVSSKLPRAILMTIQVIIRSPNGHRRRIRALIDSGAALNLVSTKVTRQLDLPKTRTRTAFNAVQGTPCKESRYVADMVVSSLQGDEQLLPVTAAVVDDVTSDVPGHDMSDIRNLPQLQGITLADESFHLPGRIDLLLGAPAYNRLMMKVPSDSSESGIDVEVHETMFGWAVCGSVRAGHASDPVASTCLTVSHPTSQSLDSQLCLFWETEEPECSSTDFTSVEDIVQAYYTRTTIYNPSTCRYVVSLPKREDLPPLGESRSQAVRRYMSNERSVIRKGIWTAFQDVVQGYIDLKHAELVPVNQLQSTPRYYLPMHSVAKLTSTTTKLRVVFDGSAPTSSGHSLNQSLLTGPTLHPTLTAILLKFRSYRVAVTADISKMYREVELEEGDRDLHRFVWRPTPSDQLKDYRMTRVTFGVSSSPYLAVRTLQQTALDHGEAYPVAKEHILQSFYVDDLLSGAATEEEALQLVSDLRSILEKGGFNLRKWRSSSTTVLDQIPSELREKMPIKSMTDQYATNYPRALGLDWDSSSDTMTPHINVSPNYITTKRGIVSDVSKTFDILGWISPSVLVMKLAYQQLWVEKVQWDQQVPDCIQQQHSEWREQLPSLADKSIPRCYTRPNSTHLTLQLHGFSDASKRAYGAVVYVRTTYFDQPPLVSLVNSKTKVATLKATTIPRLELCGAVLLTKLMSTVQEALSVPDDDVHAWCDSTIVLSWLDGSPRDYKTFVSNRVSLILKVFPPAVWAYVPTHENPADCASRGMMPLELLEHTLWWHGPSWLHTDTVQTPAQPTRRTSQGPDIEVMLYTVSEPVQDPILEERHSNYDFLLAVTGWCLRFVNRLCHNPPLDSDAKFKYLTVMELDKAEQFLVHRSQARSFPIELAKLTKSQSISPSSTILSLSPFLGSDQLIRVGGRISNSSLPFSSSHPFLLHSKDHLTRLMFNTTHEGLAHCGPSLLLCHIGERAHVIGARRLSRSVCSQCTVCRRAAAATKPQLMADLPTERVSGSPAFSIVGVDYAGPFLMKSGPVRRPTIHKAYLAVFVCYNTKAVHLDMVSQMTTEAFVACLNRFVSRRGLPTIINSDHGSNFKGARADLLALYEFLEADTTNSAIRQHLLKQRIQWKHSPERAPHFGGLWEAAVKSAKFHLKRIIGEHKLTFEQYSTITAQVEACLNSRPLSPITSHDPDGVSALTPGHFLIGRSLRAYPQPQLCEKISTMHLWNTCQVMSQQFWKRWRLEYLGTLQKRNKWRNPTKDFQVDDIVLLKDDNVFRCHWPMGKITQTFPGADGHVRVVQVKTSTSLLRRPITKIVLLHRENPGPGEFQPLNAAAGGVCSDTAEAQSKRTSSPNWSTPGAVTP